MVSKRAPYRFTVGEYHKMADAGILTEDDRVELLDGEIIAMSPIGAQHSACVDRITAILVQHLGGRPHVRIQNPIRLSERSEPQPDVAVLSQESDWEHLPGPRDVLLLAEVSDTTLGDDRSRKLPMYAGAGIGEVWLVDLQGEAIERHTNPVGGSYRITVRVGRGEQIESIALPGLVVRADAVLGPVKGREA
jgi:Uma2 family endonuclease